MLGWIWVACGLLMMTLEILLPGFVLLWFGIGAVAAGTTVLLFPATSGIVQVLVFAAFAVVGPLMAARFRRKDGEMKESDAPLNNRPALMTGRFLTLEEPIRGGTGRAFDGDTLWTVEGPDLPKGAEVRVTGHQGSRLLVSPVD
jgi:membrane protein implicated in regulation of membrane protease activity